MIKQCNICKGKVNTITSIKYKSLIGLADEYEQHVGICDKCGFIFTQNPFDEKDWENRYKNENKYEYDSSKCLLNESGEYAVRCRSQKYFIDRAISGKYESIIEVGASSGYNLSLYKEKRCLGIEASTTNCRLAKELYGIEMYNGTYQEYFRENITKQYDLAFLSMTLEHIVDPYDFILKLKEMNCKYVFLEVPTLDTQFVNMPYGFFTEEHVDYFTLESLNNMMSAVGYGLLDAQIQYGLENKIPCGWPAVDTIWELGAEKTDLRSVFSSRELLEQYIKKSKFEFERIKKKIDDIPKNEKLAIWGTGNNASMLLANTSLAEKNIVKFYDSDEKKHKYTMCGKEITSFSAEDIYNCEVDSILFGTYTFQEKLADIVEPYKDLIKIYKLY